MVWGRGGSGHASACLSLHEGTIDGDAGTHYLDLEWEGMAEEMQRLKTIGRGGTHVLARYLMLMRSLGDSPEDSEADPEDGGRDNKEEAETGAEEMQRLKTIGRGGTHVFDRSLMLMRSLGIEGRYANPPPGHTRIYERIQWGS